ncbi:sigma factor-like helix-turn-helix DNA-binding protein [Streptomyces sp. NPDC048639]|uniref:sigma factor-like helix-turn-helix DNA-binding protein n=1 Tax=Streptomyces sp. NPDC048639 TaxID=3365581 RepID=UPI0037194ABB
MPAGSAEGGSLTAVAGAREGDTERVKVSGRAGARVVQYRALAEQLRPPSAPLPPRREAMIPLRYGLHDGRPHTSGQVAEHVGPTRERARQLGKQAPVQLREPNGTTASGAVRPVRAPARRTRRLAVRARRTRPAQRLPVTY